MLELRLLVAELRARGIDPVLDRLDVLRRRAAGDGQGARQRPDRGQRKQGRSATRLRPDLPRARLASAGARQATDAAGMA